MIIGIGTDHVEVERFKTLAKARGGEFIRRVFTESEIEYAHSSDDFVQRLAARFAAKEAMLKALGTGWNDEVDWKDIEIRHSASGQPLIRLKGNTAIVAARARMDRVFLSMSHTRHLATAQVVIEGNTSNRGQKRAKWPANRSRRIRRSR